MVRRIASQVHKQASRLLRQNYIKKEPAWLQAVLEHPPLTLPPKAPPPRTTYDLPQAASSSTRSASAKSNYSQNTHPMSIVYAEDQLRRQFFQDHPYETFRATSLIEGGAIESEHIITGEKWTRLRQRGRNPSPEDAIRYAVNLHEYHELALTEAYASAVAQFRALRAEHQIASKVAMFEAEAYGVEFGPSQVEIVFDKEEKAFESWKKNKEDADALAAARKRWRAIVQRDGPLGSWTRGQQYVRLWREGVRPNYSPVLNEPIITSAGLETSGDSAAIADFGRQEVTQTADFMQLQPASL